MTVQKRQGQFNSPSKPPLEGYIVKSAKRNIQQGFTLIELMIVIAIVAILVALAVPAYKDYTIRAKVGECINGAAVAKLSISEYFETVGAWPPDEDGAGTTFPAGDSKFCNGYTYQDAEGDFIILIDEAAIDAATITGEIDPQMFPVANGQGGVDWYCQQSVSTDATNVKYLPSTCRGAGS